MRRAMLLLAALGLLALAGPTGAATSTIPDGDEAALIGAINAANRNAGADTIALAPGGTYTLTQVDNPRFGPNGLPAITSEITIEGNGATITRSGSSGTPFRHFYVAPAGDLALRDIELVGGYVRGGSGEDSQNNAGAGGGAAGMGGAIFNEGTLSVEGSTLSANTAEGGMGGDYGLTGSLSTSVGGGGGGVAGEPFGGGNGGPGRYHNDFGCSGWLPGGSCYHSGMRSGGFGGNGGPGGGGGGGYGNGEGGFGGFGGGGGGGGFSAGYSAETSAGARGGPGGGYVPPFSDGTLGSNSETGFGGGGGGGGGYDFYASVGGGQGPGGLGGGDGLYGAGGGGAGAGGAIFNHAGTLTITNSTVSSNQAVGYPGGSGAGGRPAGSGQGLGGGLFNRNGAVTIQSSTFSGNAVASIGPLAPGGSGGGVFHLGDHVNEPPVPTLTMRDTIVANSAGVGPNGGPVSDYRSQSRSSLMSEVGATNLIENGDHGGAIGTTVTSDPKLGPAQDNGGPTPTLALQPGSPAIDAAGPDCPATDQRGVARPQDGDGDGTGPCDIGAFEVDNTPPTASVTTTSKRTGNATVRFSEPMDPGTLMDTTTDPVAQPSTSRTIVLLKGGPTSAAVVPAKVRCTDPTCRTVVLDPDNRLAKLKKYVVKVEGAEDVEAVGDSLAVEDLAANKLARDGVRSFRTGAR